MTNTQAFLCCSVLLTFLNLNILIPVERFFNNSGILGAQTQSKQEYTIILVGDSMTQTLGAGETILPILRKYYPNKKLHILNYGIGSTSILTLPDRLTKGVARGDETLLPILDKDFDLILIESFGNNPIPAGLEKNNEILDQSIRLIKEKKPNTKIVFVATIAPNQDRYAENIEDLTIEERRKWADERISFIKNHINYAQDHKIPLINLFDKSLDKSADYINDSDFIHPSNNGLIFMGEEIANFIVSKRLLPF